MGDAWRGVLLGVLRGVLLGCSSMCGPLPLMGFGGLPCLFFGLFAKNIFAKGQVDGGMFLSVCTFCLWRSGGGASQGASEGVLASGGFSVGFLLPYGASARCLVKVLEKFAKNGNICQFLVGHALVGLVYLP